MHYIGLIQSKVYPVGQSYNLSHSSALEGSVVHKIGTPYSQVCIWLWFWSDYGTASFVLLIVVDFVRVWQSRKKKKTISFF